MQRDADHELKLLDNILRAVAADYTTDSTMRDEGNGSPPAAPSKTTWKRYVSPAPARHTGKTREL